MGGLTDLNELLRSLDPVLHKGRYVFLNIPASMGIDTSPAIAIFREKEGTTYVLPEEKAAKLPGEKSGSMAWITLNVHSSLEAVGLTAAVAKALAKENISCNVIAAYYHDHIFVPESDAEKSLLLLQNLTQNI